MTLTNGDSSNSTSQLMSGLRILDYTKAFEVMSDEFAEGDGLDAKTLLDSKINGGLTYNDFLVLPGYIGTFKPPWSSSHWLTSHTRLCCVRCRLRYPSNQANLPQNTTGLFPHGHSHRALHGNPHGSTRRAWSHTSQLLCRGSSRDGPKGQTVRERLHPRPCRTFTEDNRGRSEGTEREMGIRWISSDRSVFLFDSYALRRLPFYDYQTMQITFVHPKRSHRPAEIHSSTL